MGKGQKRVGFFGGTFDPIHYGHLIMAQTSLDVLGLDEIVFVPSGNPPHKTNLIISPFTDRIKMVRLATKSNEGFVVSDIEKKSQYSSYTIDSLRAIIKLNPLAEVNLLIGMDQAHTLSTWKEPNKIFDICKVAVLQRPGYDIKGIEPLWRKRITMVPVPLIEISASDIRERVSRHKSIEYLVPAGVRKYIDMMGLYKSNV
jgi:nicotinate-nucleotide adenylyltransferase